MSQAERAGVGRGSHRTAALLLQLQGQMSTRPHPGESCVFIPHESSCEKPLPLQCCCFRFHDLLHAKRQFDLFYTLALTCRIYHPRADPGCTLRVGAQDEEPLLQHNKAPLQQPHLPDREPPRRPRGGPPSHAHLHGTTAHKPWHSCGQTGWCTTEVPFGRARVQPFPNCACSLGRVHDALAQN